MKYYAVTEDPNELLHYGRLGMKWGKHIFGDKPRSSGYKRALGKLKASVSKTKSSIQKSSAQRAITKQNKQQERYAKAVQKAQNRVNIIEGMNSLNKLQNYEKKVEQDYKAQRNAEKAAMKQAKQYAKNEKRMQKYTQQAREGRLKYGKLSDDQVRQITDRLALERSARSLGNTEKAKFKYRMKEALQEGIIQGTIGGTAAGMTEVARAKVQNHYANKRVLDKQAEQKAERERKANRIRNKRTAKEVREDIRDEAYEAEVREGQHWGAKSAARSLKEIEKNRLEDERKRKLQARINDEMDMGNNETYQKFLTEQSEKKRVQDIQDRLANEKDEAWQRYLSDNNMNDEEARAREFLPKGKPITYKFNGKPITIMDGGQASEKERRKLNEGKIKGAGSVEEQRQRILNKEKEAQKEKEQEALETYEKIQQYNEKKASVDRHNERAMNVYQQQLAEFNRKERKKRPVAPTIANGKLLADPTMPKVRVEQYKTMQDLHLSLYSGNNNGGNKGGNKKKGNK